MGFPYSSGDVLTAADLNASSGLVLVKTQTIGSAVSSVTVTDAFSATFDNYRIICSNPVNSVAAAFDMTVGSKTTGYYGAGATTAYNTTGWSDINISNGAYWRVGEIATSSASFTTIDIMSPYASSKVTTVHCHSFANGVLVIFGGDSSSSTASFTSFTLKPSGGTMTGGTIRVYGYNNG